MYSISSQVLYRAWSNIYFVIVYCTVYHLKYCIEPGVIYILLLFIVQYIISSTVQEPGIICILVLFIVQCIISSTVQEPGIICILVLFIVQCIISSTVQEPGIIYILLSRIIVKTYPPLRKIKFKNIKPLLSIILNKFISVSFFSFRWCLHFSPFFLRFFLSVIFLSSFYTFQLHFL